MNNTLDNNLSARKKALEKAYTSPRDSRAPVLPLLSQEDNNAQDQYSEPALRLPDESCTQDLPMSTTDPNSSLQPRQLTAPCPGFYKMKTLESNALVVRSADRVASQQKRPTPQVRPAIPIHEPIPRFDPQTGKPLQPYIAQQPRKDKIAAGLLGLCLGRWGAHKFYLGLTKQGATMFGFYLVGIITSVLAIINMATYASVNDELAIISLIFFVLGIGCTATIRIIALVESFIYFFSSPEKFFDRYEVKKIGWF